MVHTCITQKYPDLPGVRKYHDFLFVASHDVGVVMKVRENCFSGSWSESPLRVKHADADGTPTITYRDTRTRQLTSEKMANIITMYDRFISPHRRPDYLPSCIPSTSTAPLSTPSTSSSLPGSSTLPSNSPAVTSPRRRKKSKCSTVGCDGTGHKNPSKWAQGHTPKAGCPRLK